MVGTAHPTKLIGVTTVLAGFLLVVWKIARSRGFLWLIERQLWALCLGLYLLAVLPLDNWIHRYNVARVLAGDRAPVVQITEHEVDVSGLAALGPLLDCDDPQIRDGIRARLSMELHSRLHPGEPAEEHWTAFQLAERSFCATLETLRPKLDLQSEPADRAAAWERFRTYAYQWY